MRTLSIVTIAFMLTAAGCAQRTDPNAALLPDVRSPISDVPIPAGFSMSNNSTSKVVPADSIRVVDHRYTGSDGIGQVANFYKSQLPQRQWTLIDQTQPSGKEVVLRFSKSSEDCTVTVTRETFDTQIRVRIDPVKRNAGAQ